MTKLYEVEMNSKGMPNFSTAKEVPERKTGKWNTYCHGDIDFSYSCNQCGYSAPYQMIGGEVFQKKWNFCPNCGSYNGGDANV